MANMFPIEDLCVQETECKETAVGAIDVTLVPLDFTYVVYDSSSLVSLLLAYLTYLPILAGTMLFAAVLLRRDLEAIYQLTGLVFSSAVNTVLKKLIKQPRPAGSVKTGHGMPSDHAQFSFFFVVYVSAWMWQRVRLSRVAKAQLLALLLVTSVIVCWSRVHLGVHSFAQVVAGAITGSILGWLWAAWGRVCVWRHLYPWVERSRIGQTWFLKDCSINPLGVSLARFEYELYQTAKTRKPNAVVPVDIATAAAIATQSNGSHAKHS